MVDRTASRALARLAGRAGVALVAVWLASSLAAPLRADDAAARSGGLIVASDPAGASIYLDGRLVGVAPATLSAPSGAHRVRLVLNGFLENARLVDVAAGRTVRLDAKLTRYAGAALGASPSGGGGSFFGSKWFWIPVALAGAGGGYYYWKNMNHAPSAGNVTVVPSTTGMAGLTAFTFNSIDASDKDGNPLTRTWDFGDGNTGAGSAALHTYNSTGAFTAKVFVSDGKKQVTGPSVTVNVAATMAGTWTGGNDPLYGLGVTWTLTHTTAGLGGTFKNSNFGASPGLGLSRAAVGALSYPTSITLTSIPYAFYTAGHVGDINFFGELCVTSFSGNLDGSGATMSGQLTTQCANQGTFSAGATFHR